MHTCTRFEPGAQPYDAYVALRDHGPITGLELARRVGTTCVPTVESAARHCMHERGLGTVPPARYLTPGEKEARGYRINSRVCEYTLTTDVPQARTPHATTSQDR
jgi:hypothetical protein